MRKNFRDRYDNLPAIRQRKVREEVMGKLGYVLYLVEPSAQTGNRAAVESNPDSAEPSGKSKIIYD